MDAAFSDLIRRAQAGEADALTELHARYERRVAGVVRRRLGPSLRRRCDTADLAQSVFEDVLRELPRFEDRGEPAFRRWLDVKSENKVRDAWRRVQGDAGAAREDPLGSRDDAIAARSPGPATAAGDRDDRARLHEVVSSLPEEQREVIDLRDRQGLPFAEIAERLHLSGADAARMRYARALLALRREWDRR